MTRTGTELQLNLLAAVRIDLALLPGTIAAGCSAVIHGSAVQRTMVGDEVVGVQVQQNARTSIGKIGFTSRSPYWPRMQW